MGMKGVTAIFLVLTMGCAAVGCGARPASASVQLETEEGSQSEEEESLFADFVTEKQKEESQDIPYRDLLRYEEENRDSWIHFKTVFVENAGDGRFLCYANEDEKYLIRDERQTDGSPLQEGDVLEIWGVYTGLVDDENGKDEIVTVDAMYISAGGESPEAAPGNEAAPEGMAVAEAEAGAPGGSPGNGESEMAPETMAEADYDFNTSNMYTYAQMEADIQRLADRYGDCVTWDSLVRTADGRELYHLVIGDLSAKKHVLVMASIHAREYIVTQLVMRQLKDFLEKYEENQTYQGVAVRELMKDTAIHFVPMVNPDGVTLCQLGIDGIQLPEMRQQIDRISEMDGAAESGDYFRTWKSNAMGVDLNRNFDAKWELYNDHLGHPSSDHYKGTAYESEAEVKALVELTRTYPFRRTISYHTQGNVIYWYFGQEGDFRDECQRFAEAVSAETGYVLDADYEKLDPAGYKDWAIDKMRIPSLTIEVGSGTSPIPSSQLEEIWERNRNVCLLTVYGVYSP